jgi:D-alanyl-D-alanine carboxypeptidase
MPSTAPARTTVRRTPVRRLRVVGLLVVVLAAAAHLGDRILASSPSTAEAIAAFRPDHRGALGEADGAVPDGTTVFDYRVPGVVRLDPALLGALRRAATSAADVGIALGVESGWRSPAYQRMLRREAVSTYGSAAEAARWVATPATSEHVAGHAADIGPPGAAAWLAQHGAAYGLCRIYDNEPWHYELRPGAASRGCPATYADPTQDPRMLG